MCIVVNVGWFFLSHRLVLARAARDAGYRVVVATDLADPSEADRIRAEGFAFARLRIDRASINPVRALGICWQLLALYRRERPDVVHHVTPKPVLLGTAAARLARVPAVVNAVAGLGYAFVDGDAGARRRLVRALAYTVYRLTLRHPRMGFIFQNESDRGLFRQILREGRRSEILTKGSGVDLARFASSPEPRSPVIVLLAARMLRDKGVVEFAESIARLRAEGIAVEGWLAGPVDEVNPTHLSTDELRGLEIRCGVRWLGPVADMAELYRLVHIACLPTYYREGMPLSLLEAAAAGRPIVTTDLPGCRDIVQQGVHGFVVPPRDIDALTGALRTLATDATLRREMGANARTRAEQEFGVDRVVRQTLELYSELLANARGPRSSA
ncbi:MAG: glycosyltransferase family 4 protein [Proteobacteria bacterium]|nr:glycosyltransferase family 4 protein [Pseudomonadota bacterium]